MDHKCIGRSEAAGGSAFIQNPAESLDDSAHVTNGGGIEVGARVVTLPPDSVAVLGP